jgi:hypothetical protein
MAGIFTKPEGVWPIDTTFILSQSSYIKETNKRITVTIQPHVKMY